MSLTWLAGFTHETGICSHQCQRRKAVKFLASRLLAAGRTFGPYLAVELVMPGGSLLALLAVALPDVPRPGLEVTGVSRGPMSFNRHSGSTHVGGNL